MEPRWPSIECTAGSNINITRCIWDPRTLDARRYISNTNGRILAYLAVKAGEDCGDVKRMACTEDKYKKHVNAAKDWYSQYGHLAAEGGDKWEMKVTGIIRLASPGCECC